MAIDYNPLFEEVDKATLDTFRKQEKSTETVAMTFVIMIVVALFGFFFVVSAISSEATGGARPERIALIVAIALTLAAAAFFVYRIIARAGALRRYRLTKFAVRNGMLYSTTATPPRFQGAIFNVGNARAVYERLWSDTDPAVELGNYRYTTGSGKNKTTHHWSYLALRLPRRLPHMLLDAKGNNSLFGSNLPIRFGRDQRLSLEGDFDEHFTLYCPREYEADALYVFTPDLMALLIDQAANLDVEIMDDWMLVYAKSKLDFSDPHRLSRLLGIVDTVGKKTRSRSARYADDRILHSAKTAEGERVAGAPLGAARLSHNLIAPNGRRLKSGTPWLIFSFVAVAMIAWFFIRILAGV
ncbi:MAG TPA: hypothetical protein PK890_08560 [Terrimesophilobacter sp.]|nr:hypothetical protein [Terrimesophilobacter sp.]